MGNLGIGVMNNAPGSRGSDDFSAFIGREIASVSVDDDRCNIEFVDGSALAISDVRQLCCEERYMRTDDDLDYHKGATLVGIEEGKAGEESETGDKLHEIAFVDIKTSRGVITLASHNVHNGCYGGFALVVRACSREVARKRVQNDNEREH